MPSVAIPGQPSPLRSTSLQPSSPQAPTPPFVHSAPSPTQSHRSTSSSISNSSKDASLGSYHSAHQQQPLQPPPPPSPRGPTTLSGPSSHPPPLRSVDSSRSVQLADENQQGLAREQSMRGQLGIMGAQPLPLPRGGGGTGGGWNVPLPSSNPSDEIWGNPKRLSSNESSSSNGWEPEGHSDLGSGSGAGGVVAGSVEDELEMALKRSPLVKSLLNRLSTTESAILNLTSQLSQLSSTVSTLLPSSSSSLLLPASDSASTITPSSLYNHLNNSSSSANVITPKASTTSEFSPSSAISLLASQVVALSSSVTQLQALAARGGGPGNGNGGGSSQGPGPNGTPWEVVQRNDYASSGGGGGGTQAFTPGGGQFGGGASSNLNNHSQNQHNQHLSQSSLGPAFNLVLPPSKPPLSSPNPPPSSSQPPSNSNPPPSAFNLNLSNLANPGPPSPRGNGNKPPPLLTSVTSSNGGGLTLGGQQRGVGVGGGVGGGRPGLNGRSYSTPYGGGGNGNGQEKIGGGGVNGNGVGGNGQQQQQPRRPGGFSRMDSYNEPTTPSSDLPTPGGGGGWPQPPPGQVTPGGSSGLGPGAAHNMVKWDQVGLVPELLRGVLKYGIGPPNKVQQRALPFLLRGSDIIAQAPPTQERIIAYVVPAINICLSNPSVVPYRGPQIVIITTTVDQATQAYKLVRDIATPLGVRSSLCVGPTTATSATGTWIDEQRMVAPSVIIGTPAKINELFSGGQIGRGLSGDGVRFLVIDEVDQLIARNLYEFVIEVVKRFPLPRSRSGISNTGMMSPSTGPPQSPYDAGASSPFNPTSNTQFPSMSRRFPAQNSNPAGTIGSASLSNNPPSTPGGSTTSSSIEGSANPVDRQTCLFSNTVPQDVLNFSNAIQVREPVRVLVRREGGGAGGGSSSSSGGGGGGAGTSTDPTTPQGGPNNGGGGGLKHLYLYLAFTSGGGGARSTDGAAAGTIGSGRGAGSVGAVGTPGGGGGGEANQAKEWKLEALADLLDDEAVLPGIVFVGSESGMEAVTYKLASRGLDVTVLHPELNSQARLAAVNKFRAPSVTGRGKVLVVFDLHVKANEIGYVKLVINYDLPRSVEGYAQRVSPAVSGGGRPGVVVNLIQANGGDVEMLRSCECFFKFKCSEVPVNLREAF